MEAVTAKPMDFSARSCPNAIRRSADDSNIEPRDDPKPISGTHAHRIASQENAFLWNQQLSRKLLITLANQSAGRSATHKTAPPFAVFERWESRTRQVVETFAKGTRWVHGFRWRAALRLLRLR
jgi:hypothetical protein